MTVTLVGYKISARSILKWAYETRRLDKSDLQLSEEDRFRGAYNQARELIEDTDEGVSLRMLGESNVAKCDYMVAINEYFFDHSGDTEEDHHREVKRALEEHGFKDLEFKVWKKSSR
ncbi:hypothetical protein EIP91_010245 [Steccherinum ochraceum]|uniref:Uncharacterized protein n=1 Tax=Steccherinum ochraceum TaxID=92696 RepID=A0A4R0R0U8_9APHY|nr:hypothetical protein EIP91_010245 [Steccherinum ochraceum]